MKIMLACFWGVLAKPAELTPSQGHLRIEFKSIPAYTEKMKLSSVIVWIRIILYFGVSILFVRLPRMILPNIDRSAARVITCVLVILFYFAVKRIVFKTKPLRDPLVSAKNKVTSFASGVLLGAGLIFACYLLLRSFGQISL